jgi:hypothetical protein
MKGTGHAAPLQQPQATADAVLRFLRATKKQGVPHGDADIAASHR